MQIEKKSRTSHRELFVVSKDAPFQFVEAYKSLRTNLEFLSATSNCKTILITSSVPEEGKSNVAINSGHHAGSLQQACCPGGLRYA